MAVNSGMPNQTGLATPYIFTAVAPGGTPGPASAPSASLKVYTLGQASTGVVGSATTESIGDAGITVPVNQVVGEIQEAGVFGTITASAPTAGVPPTPAPTVKSATSAASTGQQPAVSSPFTDGSWTTKSVV